MFVRRLVFAFLLIGAGESSLADGVIEIHQACVATGCFAGDSPGWPVEITRAGSYRLTSNLQYDGLNPLLVMVSVTADQVSLDLGGHRIVANTECPPFPQVCNQDLVEGGVLVDASVFRIWNGTISGFTGVCLQARSGQGNRGFVAEDLQIRDCGQDGVVVGSFGSRVENLVVENCDLTCISSVDGIVKNNMVQNCGVGVSGGICSGNVLINANGDGFGSESCFEHLAPSACGFQTCPIP